MDFIFKLNLTDFYLSNRDGEEWLKYRKILNKLLLKEFDESQKRSIEQACDRLVNKLSNSFSNENADVKLHMYLYQWSIDGKYQIVLKYIKIPKPNYMILVILATMLGPDVNPFEIVSLTKFEKYSRKVEEVFKASSTIASIPPVMGDLFKLRDWKDFENISFEALELGNEIAADALKNSRGKTNGGLLNGLIAAGLENNDIQRIFTDLTMAAGDTVCRIFFSFF